MSLLSQEMAKLARRTIDRRLEADYRAPVAFFSGDSEDTLSEEASFVVRDRDLLPGLLDE